MSALQGQVAVITGGTSGIGFAIAQALGSAGVRVVISAREAERGEAAARQLASSMDAQFVACDVRSADDVAHLMRAVVERHGRLDMVVNAAGAEGPVAPLHEYPDEALRDVVATNFVGVALGMKYALPALLARGSGIIINVASTIGTLIPFAGGVVYGGTKAAIVSMTAAVAAGYVDQGIRAYALEPWITDTPMIDRLTGGSAEAKAAFAAMNPSGRIVTPEDVGEYVLDLVTGGGAVSGSALAIDSPPRLAP